MRDVYKRQLISRFAWILLVFGGFLVYSGAKMFLNRNKKEEINALEHPGTTSICQSVISRKNGTHSILRILTLKVRKMRTSMKGVCSNIATT